MALMVDAIVDFLRRNLTVPVIIRNWNVDRTPCVTVNQATNTQLKRYWKHDPLEHIIREYACEVWVDVWCDTEDERERIVNEIYASFDEALAGHYRQCYNFHDGECEYLEEECEALTIQNGRTAKKQCPHPKENHYCTFFSTNNIHKNSLKVDGETELDERDKTPPVLRTQIKINLQYTTDYNLGGILFEEVNIK